jgi:hypothetical protein
MEKEYIIGQMDAGMLVNIQKIKSKATVHIIGPMEDVTKVNG